MNKQKKLFTIFAIAIAVALLLPGVSLAGSLEPPNDAVNQSGNPVSTMKTLDQIPPTWSQKLPCETTANCPRFEIVMDGEAVLDKETGLVWQRTPMNVQEVWAGGQWSCHASNVGQRFGWRLPTAQELESLGDLSNDCWWKPGWTAELPCGHPFIDLKGVYWSSTTWFFDSNKAICSGGGPVDKSAELYVWCVRGGNGVNVNE
jgi:hypothetical protein